MSQQQGEFVRKSRSSDLISYVYDETQAFLVIGLTGYLGSGCTTTATYLSNNFHSLNLFPPGHFDGSSNDIERDQRIIFRYARSHWQAFDVIRTRTILTTFIIEQFDDFVQMLNEISDTRQKKLTTNSIMDEMRQDITHIYNQYLQRLLKKIPEPSSNVSDKTEETQAKTNQYSELSKEIKKEIGLLKIFDMFYTNIEKLQTFLSKLLKSFDEHDGTAYSFENYLFCFAFLPAFSDVLHDFLEKLPCASKNKDLSHDKKYTEIYQKIGNHIRISGKITVPKSLDTINCHFFDIPKRMNCFLKILRHPLGAKQNSVFPVRVVIDSFKNFFEINYIRNRYNDFYLMAVSKDEFDRKKNLASKKGSDSVEKLEMNERPNSTRKLFKTFYSQSMLFKTKERNTFVQCAAYIKEQETSTSDPLYGMFKSNWLQAGHNDPELLYCIDTALHDPVRAISYLNGWHMFFLQDVETCIQCADIFITNESRDMGKYFLTGTLAKYVSLMLHPGLVLPTPVERCMQVAYTAKLNSGCLSRKVGAVVTNCNYHILSLGWNDVPAGQVTCMRRNLLDIQKHFDHNAYSDFEQEDKQFRSYINAFEFEEAADLQSILNGLPAAYCFKDCYQNLIHERGQIYTRALHGEEMAFSSCQKADTAGGYLFTTSSPCELCAKKAKDYRISKVYYIEQYPGISQSNIFDSGDLDNRVVSELFVGAIGTAYTKLFTSLMPYKDELALRGFPKQNDEKIYSMLKNILPADTVASSETTSVTTEKTDFPSLIYHSDPDDDLGY